MTLTDEVRQALALFLPAHEQAEIAAAAFVDAKRRAGSNEKERSRICSEVGDETYALYLMDLNTTEAQHKAAAAHLERCEKELNVLRELLNHSTAELERVTSARNADTADVYARMAGTRTTMAEIRARYPAAVLGGNCPDCGQPLTLDIHDSCTPF